MWILIKLLSLKTFLLKRFSTIIDMVVSSIKLLSLKTFLFKRFSTIIDMVVLHLNFNQVAFFENQFKLVLKLSLKDQILINFTQPNSYFSYVSEHDSWALISLSWDLMTLFFNGFATCQLCICLIFELANVGPIKSIVKIKL